MNQPEATPDLQIYGAISAFGFMLENLYALIFRLENAGAEDVRATRDEMLRQFEDLPWRNDTGPSDVSFLVKQHGVHRLERIWAAIEGRLAQ